MIDAAENRLGQQLPTSKSENGLAKYGLLFSRHERTRPAVTTT